MSQRYNMSKEVLGTGNFGKVFLATSLADTSFKVAIKAISKQRVEDRLDVIRDEILILSQLDHPNIVKYYETYESPNYIYLVMECCEGGELFQRLTEQREQFTEREAARVMRSLFLAINHCHSKGIAHRDLKPENVMYGQDERVKIIDFGLSKTTHQRNGGVKKFNTVVGTSYYLAPEVLDGTFYSKECDCWSLGVIMYIVLSGFLPFPGQTHAEVYQKIKSGTFTFEHPEFQNYQPSAKDLISKLLTVDKAERYTCAQALDHPWFELLDKETEPGQELPPQVDLATLQNLCNFKEDSQLKMEALHVLARMLNETDVQHLQTTF